MAELVVASHGRREAHLVQYGNVVVQVTQHTQVHALGVQHSAPAVEYQPRALRPATPESYYVEVYHDRYSARAVHYDSCSGDTRLGTYMVVQGLFGMSIPIIFTVWHCWRCVQRKTILYFIVPIAIFIVIWFIVGFVWILAATCTESQIYKAAIGFSAPIWAIIVLLFIVCYCVCCCNKD